MNPTPDTPTPPVTVITTKNRNKAPRALTLLLVVPVLFLAGCIQAEQTEEDLPVDAATQAQIRQDFYTAVRETVEITTAYTGHDPSIYTHGTGRTFDIADVQPESDYYPYMICGDNPETKESLYTLTLSISDQSEDLNQYTPEEYREMSEHMRKTWEEKGHEVQSITLRTGGIQSVYYTDLGTRVYYATTARGDHIQVETACVLPKTPAPSPSSPSTS